MPNAAVRRHLVGQRLANDVVAETEQRARGHQHAFAQARVQRGHRRHLRGHLRGDGQGFDGVGVEGVAA